MATTTNFGWTVPTSADLVRNGATAISTLGQNIDTSMVDLKGGTTGQLLSKASGTDLDFTWTTPAGGGGKVLQVVSTTKTSAFTVNSTTMTDVTGMSVSITPTASSSKILVMVDMSGAGTPGASLTYVNLLRGSTIVTKGDAASVSAEVDCTTAIQNVDSNATASWSINYLDSPATTSATTYKIQISGTSGYVNRSTSGNYARTTSTITVMEIGA